MSVLDRAIRIARGTLGPDEGLLASVLGRETDGRRRIAVVVTDRRLLLVHLRPQPPVALPLDSVQLELDVQGGEATLTVLAAGERHDVARIRDVAAARLLAELVAQHAAAPRMEPRPGIRLVDRPAG